MDKKTLKLYQSYFPGRKKFYFPEKITPVFKRKKIKGQKSLKECVEVEITGEEFDMCANVSNIKKSGVYGRGAGNTKKDKTKVERTGMLGEMALAKVTGLPVDITDVKCPFDFVVFTDRKGDMKNATYDYGANCIRVVNEYGADRELTADTYISGYVEELDMENRYAKVVLVGWMERDVLAKTELKRARMAGNWYNFEMLHKDTKSIRSLINGSRAIKDISGNLHPV